MNGKKILVRLNWLFLGINIILLVLNLIVKGNEYRVSSERIDNIIQVLDKEGITCTKHLPVDYRPKMSAVLSFSGASLKYTIEKNFFGSDMVSVKHSVGPSIVNKQSEEKTQYCAFNKEVLAFDGDHILYENQSITSYSNNIDIESAKKLCDNLIQRIYMNRNDKYMVESEKKEDSLELTYYPVVDGIPVLDTFMKFKVCELGIASGELYVGDITMLNAEKKDMYPVDEVLFGLRDYIKGQSKKAIKEVSLVYKGLSKQNDMWGQEIVPMYKVTVDGLEEPVFVNAYTNEIVKCN